MQSKRVILKRIEEIKKDSRLHNGVATVFENAPLALIQLAAISELNALESVLELPTRSTLKTLERKTLKKV